MNSQIIFWGKFLIGWPLSIIAIIYIFRFLIKSGGESILNISNINYPYLLLGFLFFFFWFYLRAYAWRLFLEKEGYRLNLRETIYRWEFSELKRFVPGNVWSFLGRVSLFEELNVPKKIIAKGLLYEIELVVSASLFLSILSIPLAINYLGLNIPYISLVFSLFIVAFTLVFLFSEKLPLGKIKNITPNLTPLDNFIFFFIYVISCIFFGAGTFFAAHSIVSLDFSKFFEYIGFFSFSLLVGYLSFLTPSGLGVREAVVTFGLSKSILLPQAALIAIFSRFILIASELLFLVFVFLWKKLPLKK